MTLSLSDFRDAIRSEMMVDLNGQIWDDNDLNSFITASHKKVQQDFNFGFPQNQTGLSAFTTVAGTLEYDMPADYARMELVKLDKDVMGLSDKISLLALNNATQPGKPARFYVYGLKIGFDMVPDQAYNVGIFYKKWIAPPTEIAGSDLPDDLNDPIVLYSKYLAWKTPSGKAQDAAQAKADYREAINRARMQFGQYNPTAQTWGLQRR